MALPMYRQRWHHIHAFIGRNTIALRVQKFAAGASVTCLTNATDWLAVIGPVIHGESKSQATRSSLDHVGTLSTIDTRVKTRGASCIEGFGQTDGRRKFELGIPQNRAASYIRGASYIRDKKVIFFNIRIPIAVWYKTKFGSQNLASKIGNLWAWATKIGSQH